MSVVVIGDANVDLEIRLPMPGAPADHANPEPRLFGGGSAANTAAALARLGVSCRFVGAVGDDNHGRFAISSLSDAGVDVGSVQTTSEVPTVEVIVVVPPDGDRLVYVWPPSGGAHGELSVEAALAATESVEWLHVSGICLRLPQSRAAVLAAMEHANHSGVPVSFDLNLRIENWAWDDGFRAVVEAAVAFADVVLGSAADEIVPLAGIDDPIDAATFLAGDHRLVIARLGAEGAVACSAAEPVWMPSFEVDVSDTIGAGDAFNAGFIAVRMESTDIAKALRWGNAVAALSVSRPGARSTPTLPEVEELLSR